MAIILFVSALAGCGSPNKANIELRKQNQDLTSQVDQLKREKETNLTTIASLEKEKGTLPTLPNDRLEKMFVATSLSLGRLTGGSDFDSDKPGDQGVKIYVVPTDQNGEPIKSAGAFTVEAFDLSKSENPLIGKWDFPLEDAAKNWYGQAMLYTYVLPCPWQKILPSQSDVTLKITFKDELTQRTFTAQKVVKIRLPIATTQPS